MLTPLNKITTQDTLFKEGGSILQNIIENNIGNTITNALGTGLYQTFMVQYKIILDKHLSKDTSDLDTANLQNEGEFSDEGIKDITLE